MVLWGTKKGSPTWAEEVITETNDKQKLEQARNWAEQNGYINMRILFMDGKKPDFTGTIRT